MERTRIRRAADALWARARALLDAAVWSVAHGTVEAVRYQPRHADLVMACGVDQPEVPALVARWWADTRVGLRVYQAPHAGVTRVAASLGPTGSALLRWLAGAVAAAIDHAVALLIERPLRGRVHPGLLVPHPHEVAVLAADMRGFSNLTHVLDDTQYVADLVGEYLTELTRVIERHRGVVFQYTGDGLLALFLPEMAGVAAAPMVDRLVHEVSPGLHRAFDALHGRWRRAWRLEGRPEAEIGLGVGLSFGRATIGFIGPSGKKQFGAIGQPVNLAAFLCAAARAGTVCVDRESFDRAGAAAPPGPSVQLLSAKPYQWVEVLCVSPADRRALPAPRASDEASGAAAG